jgi:hypothetical protein
MSPKIKLVLFNLLIIFVLLVAIEAVCCKLVGDKYHNVGFLINRHQLTEVFPYRVFNEIDPLLGYAKSTSKLEREGFKVESNCMILSTTEDTVGLINILITGGSTTDPSLDANNWPVELCKILKEHGVKAKLYVAAVGGYNSGQEVLKVMRDGLEVAPAIHLSYSSANDIVGSQAFVSYYEQFFYEQEFLKETTFWLMPNTVLLLRNALKLNSPDVYVHPHTPLPSAQFWLKNMRLMHGMAVENNYAFIGLLQPVLGSGKFDQKIPVYEVQIEKNKQTYPSLKEAAKQHPDFLVDLTAIFDTCTPDVFQDNCHIHDPYQKIVAQNIYAVMMQKPEVARVLAAHDK